MSRNVPSLVTGHVIYEPGSALGLLWVGLGGDRDVPHYINNCSAKDAAKADSVESPTAPLKHT